MLSWIGVLTHFVNLVHVLDCAYPCQPSESSGNNRSAMGLQSAEDQGAYIDAATQVTQADR